MVEFAEKHKISLVDWLRKKKHAQYREDWFNKVYVHVYAIYICS